MTTKVSGGVGGRRRSFNGVKSVRPKQANDTESAVSPTTHSAARALAEVMGHRRFPLSIKKGFRVALDEGKGRLPSLPDLLLEVRAQLTEESPSSLVAWSKKCGPRVFAALEREADATRAAQCTAWVKSLGRVGRSTQATHTTTQLARDVVTWLFADRQRLMAHVDPFRDCVRMCLNASRPGQGAVLARALLRFRERIERSDDAAAKRWFAQRATQLEFPEMGVNGGTPPLRRPMAIVPPARRPREPDAFREFDRRTR